MTDSVSETALFEQLKVKVVEEAERDPVKKFPLGMLLVPCQSVVPPEPEQEAGLFLTFQRRVVLPPADTFVWSAVKLMSGRSVVGGGVCCCTTSTLAVVSPVPPGPVQVTLYV